MAAAAGVFADGVASAAEPMTGSEDFARFLDHVPGCFIFLGNGEASAPLHNPQLRLQRRGLLHGARFPCRDRHGGGCRLGERDPPSVLPDISPSRGEISGFHLGACLAA